MIVHNFFLCSPCCSLTGTGKGWYCQWCIFIFVGMAKLNSRKLRLNRHLNWKSPDGEIRKGLVQTLNLWCYGSQGNHLLQYWKSDFQGMESITLPMVPGESMWGKGLAWAYPIWMQILQIKICGQQRTSSDKTICTKISSSIQA